MLGVTDDLFARPGEILVLKQKLTSTLCWIQNGDSWRACHSINYWTTFFPWSKKSITEQFLPKKIQFSGLERLGFLVHMLLKASSGERCAPQNFVHLAIFWGTRVHLSAYLVVHQIKYLVERWSSTIKFYNFLM